MVIRCSNCNSAYAVNDSKVANKKFAFNCPNCSAENIIDNRSSIASKVATGGDLAADMGQGGLSQNMEFQGQEESAVLTDDSASTEISEESDIMGESDLDFDEDLVSGLADEAEELAKDFTTDEMETAVSAEPEESSIDAQLDEAFGETIETPSSQTIIEEPEVSEDLTMPEGTAIAEESAGLEEDDLGDLDENLSLDDFDTDLSSLEEASSEMNDIDQLSTEEEFIAHEESLDLADAEDLDFSLDEEPIGAEGAAETEGEKLDEALTFGGIEDDLDLDFDMDDIAGTVDDLDLDLTFDDKNEQQTPQVVKDELDTMEDTGISDDAGELPDLDDVSDDFENEIIDESESLTGLNELPDLDEIKEEPDIMGDLDDLPDIGDISDEFKEEPQDELSDEADLIGDFEDLPDIDDLNQEFDEEPLVDSKKQSDLMGDLDGLPNVDTLLDDMPVGVMKEPDSLDSDFQPVEDDSYLSGEGEDGVPGVDGYTGAEDMEDDSITIDLDSLDIDLEEGDDDVVAGSEFLEEDIHINIPENVEEELEIDLPENVEEELEIDIPETIAGDDMLSPEVSLEHEEDTTLDLDSLDIDIDESAAVMAEGETPDSIHLDDELEQPAFEETSTHDTVFEEDETLTLDLDSLDIPVVESDDVLTGETINEEDEKLTLEDAGLTIEELTSEEAIVVSGLHDDQDEDEDIKLTIDEIDPSLNLDNIEDELAGVASYVDDGLKEEVLDEDLIDLEYDEEFREFSSDEELPVAPRGVHVDDNLIELDEEIADESGIIKSKKEMIHKVARGSVNFSIDYSLKYSRIRALLRIFGIYFLGLIPHLFVYFIYNILSLILGFLNQLIVFTTGANIEDFSEIQENTIRYLLSIFATSSGIIDELPIFTGREDIDYPLQLNVTYPLRYSKVLAAIRLSIVGLFIINLPHWIILGLLTLTMPIIAIIGILSVVVTGRWPHFLFDILTRYYRYYAKILAFSIGLVDSYPSFDFK